MQTDVISATHENVLIPLAAQYNIVFSMYSYCASLQTFIMSCWWEPRSNTTSSSIEHFHHVMKNDVSLHNSVILLHMTAVLVYK